jgi:hypothetical protein
MARKQHNVAWIFFVSSAKGLGNTSNGAMVISFQILSDSSSSIQQLDL